MEEIIQRMEKELDKREADLKEITEKMQEKQNLIMKQSDEIKQKTQENLVKENEIQTLRMQLE